MTSAIEQSDFPSLTISQRKSTQKLGKTKVEVRYDDHENTPQGLELRSGSTTLTIDKEAGKIEMKRKTLLWQRAPSEKPLREIADVRTH